jgi:serine protease Do
MKFLGVRNIAALSAVLLGGGTLSGALPGQTPAKPAAHSSSAKASSADQNCANFGFDAEQIKQMLRNNQLEQKLAGLSQRLAKEEAMSSPEIARLQDLSARLEGKEGELEAQARAVSSHAQEIASEAVDRLQENGNLLMSQDNDAGWLGVEIAEVTPEKAKELKLPAVRGVTVGDVESDSPAAKAGLKQNDVILDYDGQTVEGTVQFRRLVRETPPGRTVNVVISRDGAKQSLTVQVANRNAYYEKRMRGAMPEFGKSFSFQVPNFEVHSPEMFLWMNAGSPTLGIEAEDLSGQLGAYFGAPNDTGVLVRSVRAGTPAQKAGLKAGDVIVRLDGAAVKSVSGLREQLREKREQKSVNLGVLRKGSELNVTVELEHPSQENPQAIHTAVL